MAVFKITPTSSVIQSPFGFNAFVGDTAGPDSLVVDPGGFLMTVDPNTASAAVFDDTGAWTITVNGVIFAEFGAGLDFVTKGSGTPLTHTITIGKDGSVFSGSIGVWLASAAKITNAGFLTGEVFAISQTTSATTTISNSGTISGNILASGLVLTTTKDSSISGEISASSTATITNAGGFGGSITLGGTNDKITNSGSIIDSPGGQPHVLDMGGGNDTLINSGTIGSGDLFLGEGNDTVTNSGSILNNLQMGSGNNKVTNSKSISGTVFFGDGADTLTNSGTISQGINFGQGVNKLTNSGTITGSDVAFGNDADTVSNTGTITVSVNLGGGSNVLTNSKTISGAVFGGAGADKVTNNGFIGGSVLLGEGDDVYSGTGVATEVIDNGGNDTYTFGAKGGTFLAIGANSHIGTDKVTGGSVSSDIYDLTGASTSSVINLDSKAHGVSDFPSIFATDAAANTAKGSEIGTDIVKGIDIVVGTNQQEVIFGSATSNVLFGKGNQDLLFGFGGNDFIAGGEGSDLIVGGAGADGLTGNGGSDPDGATDAFRYFSVTESGPTAATRDTIFGFEDGVDRIELNPIDANTTQAGDQAFKFIGFNTGWATAGPNAGPGQLRAYFTAAGYMIEGDVNGDLKADLQIAIFDSDHVLTIDQNDFIL